MSNASSGPMQNSSTWYLRGAPPRARSAPGRRRRGCPRRPADGHAADAGRGEGHVEHAGLAEPGVEPIRGAEDTALAPDVLAPDEHALVALHLLGDGCAHSLDHPHLSHLLYPSTTHCPPRSPAQ